MLDRVTISLKRVQYWDKFAIFAIQMVKRVMAIESAKFHPLPDY